MATWGLHLRIAQALLEKGCQVDWVSFLVGNIGPDCGLANDDMSQFDPPAAITHWCDGNKLNIEAHRFAFSYLEAEPAGFKERSFYLGYYVHLLCDKKFAQLIQAKIDHDENYRPLHGDFGFITTIKKDWYDLDRLYFRDNPDSLFFSHFCQIDDFPDYLDYYPPKAVITQVKFIRDFYQQDGGKLDREYLYLSVKEMDQFVKEMLDEVAIKLERYLK